MLSQMQPDDAAGAGTLEAWQHLLERTDLVVHLVPIAFDAAEYTSPSYADVFGSHDGEWTADGRWVHVHPDDRPNIQSFFDQGREAALRGDRALLDGLTAVPLDNRVIDRDGRVRRYRWFGFPVYAADGSVHQICLMGRDVTDLGGSEVDLVVSEVNARGAALVQADTVVELAHDLINLLQPIAGYADLLVARLDDAEQAEWAARIQRAAASASALLHEAALDAWLGSATAFSVVDAREAVQAAVELAEPLAAGAGMALSVDIAAVPMPVRCSRERLQLVAVNLLSNAVKYGSTMVEATLRCAGPHMELVVADDGPGVAEEDIERVFVLGERLGGTTAEGSGVGLAVTRQTVLNAGGTISAGSGPNGGAVFRVEIPLVLD